MKSVAQAMREVGALKYIGHGIEILLGPEPATPEEKTKKKDDPLASRRSFYELQLGRRPTDDELKYLP